MSVACLLSWRTLVCGVQSMGTLGEQTRSPTFTLTCRKNVKVSVAKLTSHRSVSQCAMEVTLTMLLLYGKTRPCVTVIVKASQATPLSDLPDRAILLSKQVSSGQQKPIGALLCVAALLAQPCFVTTVGKWWLMFTQSKDWGCCQRATVTVCVWDCVCLARLKEGRTSECQLF